MGLGQVERAIEQYELALIAAERTNDKTQMAVAHENLGIENFVGGRFAAGR